MHNNSMARALRAGAFAAALVPAAASAAPAPAVHAFVPHQAVTTPKATGAMELYYGGAVIAQPQVTSVMWGPNVNPATVSGIPAFYQAIVNSTFVDLLGAQYSTKGAVAVNGHPSTNQTIVRGSYKGQVVITPHNTATTLSTVDIARELALQVRAHKLPAAGPNVLYMVHFPANITLTIGKAQSCTSFGAYHEALYAMPNAKNIFFGAIPDCNFSFQAVTYVSSHEFAEAVTDSIPTPGSHPKYPQAWNTSDGYEIGDLCEGQNPTTLAAGSTTYTVTPVWDNSANACSATTFTSP